MEALLDDRGVQTLGGDRHPGLCAPLRAIQEWMGHADAKTTEIYRHYAPDPSNGAAFVERAFDNGDHAPSDTA